MECLLLALALFILMLGGFGLSCLLMPEKSSSVAERLGLSFLLGAMLVSLTLFVFGFLISGVRLRWAVAGLCVLLGLAGLRQKTWSIKLRDFWPATKSGWLLLAFSAVQLAAVVWLSFVRVLGWDGLLNFEVKARVAFLNGGTIPLEFFSDPSRTWTHQAYPLLLPLTQSWLYSWLGRADQELVKILFPLFFATALCLLHAANRRLGMTGWQVLIAPLLMFTAPLLLIGDGSASSGYADFPLAVFYLAAIVWWLDFWQRADVAAFRLSGLLLAGACWLKQEGLILWFCLMVLLMFRLWADRIKRPFWRSWLSAALPGLIVITLWRAFVRLVNPPGGNEFLPINSETLLNNFWRLPNIAQAVLKELANWRHWGVFWIVTAVALIWLLFFALRQKRCELAGIVLAVLMPMTLYSGVYVFSIWPDFIGHLASSFPRLLIHLSLVAALMAAATLRTQNN